MGVKRISMIESEEVWENIENGKDPLGEKLESHFTWPNDKAYWNDFINTVNKSRLKNFKLKELIYKEPVVISTLKDGDFEITFTIKGRYGDPTFWKVDTFIESTFLKKDVGRYDWGSSGVACANNLWSQLVKFGFMEKK